MEQGIGLEENSSRLKQPLRKIEHEWNKDKQKDVPEK